MAVLGIFVGGQSRRMGGGHKGLLQAPSSAETLIARLARIGREVGLEPVLVGSAALDSLEVTLPSILDHEPHVGPLSGLSAILEYSPSQPCIAVGCDMPRISAALLSRLLRESPGAPVLAPRDHATGKWDPLFARYEPSVVQPVLTRALAAGARSFQALFRELSVTELALSDAERGEIVDWDTPADITRK
jgi:molybdopterin-guanine dinucleotide biosynthesis protein A